MYVSLVERLNGIQDLPSIPNTLNKVLSELFVEAIRYHHRPQGAGPYTAHASVLFLADQLCKKLQIGWHGEDVDNRLLNPKTLSLSQDIIKGVAIYMKEQKNEIERAWDEVLST